MKKIEINTKNSSKCEILIEEGISKNIQNYLKEKRYFLITNTTLKKLYGDFVSQFSDVIVIDDGEKYKNFKTYEYIINELLKRKIERKDCIVALGGGVIGDIAGFCASTVLRGVQFIQIPTTLLAMCDSSIGGKTAINTQQGKNLVGTFYSAKKVFIDPLFLDTLNEREFKCGMGEVLKYAFIEKSCNSDFDYDLISFFKHTQKEELRSKISYIIEACASLKASVVRADEHEAGLRKILNFGHTYAHAFETLSNYKNISHGEAVAHGIKCASKLALNLKKINFEYFTKIISLIDKFELTNNKIKFKKQDIINIMYSDKKVVDGKINLLCPVDSAVVELFDNIDLPSLEASLP